tara:strand:- start:2822 stop:3262 length:441 start_codon:yes stop_codon:yes gene_type:complete
MSYVLSERLLKTQKLLKKSAFFEVYYNIEFIQSATPSGWTTLDIGFASTIQLVGHTHNEAALFTTGTPVYFGPDVVIEIEIRQGAIGIGTGNPDGYWPHPTHHLIVTDTSGGFIFEPLLNFGYDRLRFRVRNNVADLKIVLLGKYT